MNYTDGNMEKLVMANFFKTENICFFPNFKNVTAFSIDMSFCVMNTWENKFVCIGILYMCVFVCFSPTES